MFSVLSCPLTLGSVDNNRPNVFRYIISRARFFYLLIALEIIFSYTVMLPSILRRLPKKNQQIKYIVIQDRKKVVIAV